MPKPVILLGLMAPQVRPEARVSVRLTVPEKPFTANTVIVDVMEEPTLPEGEVAVTVKPAKANVALVECIREPLVPVIVRT